MTAQEFVKSLKNGWNLGNTLDAVPKADATATEQETAWGNPVTTKEMVQLLKSTGFGIFRVPTTWGKQLTADNTIKAEWLNRVQEIVDYGIESGLTVILNLHHEHWHFPDDKNYNAASIILKKVWQQIAERFAKYDNNLIFEAMNEPRKIGTEVEWSGGDEEGRRVVMLLNQDFVDTVRATGGNNATRMLMVPTYAASADAAALADFVMPKGDNLIASVHAYTPYPFALSNENVTAWTTEQEKIIDELFERIDKAFISKNIPVIMGECGARNKGDNTADRTAWAKYYTATAKKYNVPCVWWDNGIFTGSEKTEIFGLMDRANVKWAYPDVVKAFV
ncbi:MAG: glycoside hydrolase family 5 protein [Defluviitaleaceae bacterium]|nr:glycoside hydrolase family 5 protein [Defluviitaleaceae bacterium]